MSCVTKKFNILFDNVSNNIPVDGNCLKWKWTEKNATQRRVICI
jgi:hypothetical protein